MSPPEFIRSHLHFEEIISDSIRSRFWVLKVTIFLKCAVVDRITLNLPPHSSNIPLWWHASAPGSIQKPFILRSRPPAEPLLGLSVWQTLSVIHNTRFGDSPKYFVFTSAKLLTAKLRLTSMRSAFLFLFIDRLRGTQSLAVISPLCLTTGFTFMDNNLRFKKDVL